MTTSKDVLYFQIHKIRKIIMSTFPGDGAPLDYPENTILGVYDRICRLAYYGLKSDILLANSKKVCSTYRSDTGNYMDRSIELLEGAIAEFEREIKEHAS